MRVRLSIPARVASLVVLTLAALASGLLAEAQGVAGSGDFPPDIRRIKARGKLIVGQYKGERPMFFMKLPASGVPPFPESMTTELPDASRIGGVDIAFAKDMANALGVKLELKRDYESFDDVVTAVARNEVDIGVSKLTASPERMQRVLFSNPYAIFSISLLTNRQFLVKAGRLAEKLASGGAQLEDFVKVFNRKGTRLAVQRNTSNASVSAKFFPEAELKLFEHHEDCVKAVRDGQADATMNDDFEFRMMEFFDPSLDLYADILKLPGMPYEIGAALNPESLNLLSMADAIANRSKIDNAELFLKRNARMIKQIKVALLNEPEAVNRYPFDGDALISGRRRNVFDSKDLIGAGICGVFAALFFGALFAMSKGRKEAPHGTR